MYRSLKGPLLRTLQPPDILALHFDLTGFTMMQEASALTP